MAFLRTFYVIQMSFGVGCWIVSILLKLLPCGKTDHVHENTGGIGNKEDRQFRRPSVLSLKRIEERVERDLAKNHPFETN